VTGFRDEQRAGDHDLAGRLGVPLLFAACERKDFDAAWLSKDEPIAAHPRCDRAVRRPHRPELTVLG